MYTPGMATNELKPYAIWWRPSFIARWTLIKGLDEHPGDLETFVKAQRAWQWTGQWRLTSQHVIEETDIVHQ